MVTLTCPNPDDLRSFHLGMLDERRELEVLDHLNACQTCEDTVANLEGTADSLIAAVRNSAESESSAYEDRPALQQAMAEIEGLIDQPVSPDTKQADEASPATERIRDYELLETLGEGGMGTVYRARHTRLDRQVALKLLPARRLRDNAAVARFEREMKAIGRLDHPTIVRATDAGDVDGTHFLAMDYVEGIDLSKLVRLVGPLDVASACEIVRQAAIGLDYAHQQDLIHRDVKPSNLMLTLRGEVRILDLGLALFGAASEAVDDLTTVGQLMGTLDYMAPEQGDNSHDVDARADVYSLGATLFKLLTGTAPYETSDRRNPLQKMKALATTDPPPVLSRRADVPPELAAGIDRMLLRDPDERFQSAAEVAAAVASFCEVSELEDLAERSLQLAALQREAEQNQSRHLAPRDEPLEDSASKRQPAAHAAPSSEQGGVSGNAQPAQQNGSSRGARWLRWSTLTTIALFAGVVIWLRTDNGTLLIEADESVPVEIRSGQKIVANETLKVGQNSLTIRSGEYEIVLPKEYDSLKVENGKFELLRGGTWIARVTKQPNTPILASSSTRPERISASESVLPSPAPSSNDPFAPPFPSNDPFVPVGPSADSARQAEPATAEPAPQNRVLKGVDIPFELQTTAWRINQKLIRTGATKPVELRPQSIVGLIHQLVSYKHSGPQHPYPAFAMFRTAHDVAELLRQPGIERCVVEHFPETTRHDHTQQVGPLVGPLNNGEVRATASDGRQFTLTLSPEFHESGQISLKLNLNRQPGDEAGATAVGDVPVGVPATQDFETNRLAFGESLIVTELDPQADEIILFEIHPVRPVPTQRVNPFVSSARPTTRTPFDPEPEIPQPSLVSGRDVPLHLETEIWQIDQAAYRAGTTGLPLVEPRSAKGVVEALLSNVFTAQKTPADPLPAADQPATTGGKRWDMFRSSYDIRQRLTSFPFTRCISPALPGPLASKHDHVRQVGSLTGPLSSHEFPFRSASDAEFHITVTPELLDDQTVSLELQLARSGPNAPQAEQLSVESLRWDDTILLLELEPAAKTVSLLLIRPRQPASSARRYALPTAAVPDPFGPAPSSIPSSPPQMAVPQVMLGTSVWDIDESKLAAALPPNRLPEISGDQEQYQQAVFAQLLQHLGWKDRPLAQNESDSSEAEANSPDPVPALDAVPLDAVPVDSVPFAGFSEVDVSERLRAMLASEAVKCLAAPTVGTQFGRTATMFSGGEFPVLKPEPNDTTSASFRDFGWKLDVEPRQVKSGIWLDLNVELADRLGAIPATDNNTPPQQAEPVPQNAKPLRATSSAVKRRSWQMTLAMPYGQTLILVERGYRPGRTLILTLRPERVEAHRVPLPGTVSPAATSSAPSSSEKIPPGMRVVPVRIDPNRSIPELLMAGDAVDLLVVGPQQTGPGLKVWTLAESLEVFSHRPKLPDGAEPSAVLVLATAEQAREITLVEGVGDFHIALRSRETNSSPVGTPLAQRPQIPNGMLVVSVPAEPSAGTGGLIRPGDHIDLLVTLSAKSETGRDRQVETLAESLEVFDGGTPRSTQQEQQAMLLLVTPEQARVIKLAETVGQLHILLRARDSKSTMTLSDLTALEKILSEPDEMP